MKDKNDENITLDEKDQNLEDFQDKIKEDIENESRNDELTILQSKLDEMTDKLYRANADFDNMKKRLEKEKDNAVAYSNEKFARDILPIADALEEALKIDVGDNEFANKIKDGVGQCVEMFLKCFEKYGIKQIDTNVKFDPEFHNAISMVESENAQSGDIVQVYQKGYLYNDRVLRASMVVVAK